ncbi:RNA-binding S4 domain-containing protein [Mycoplasma sp. P36-A1]|uniref:RNA-binding S4 domain-containing protein n=1 Tax=Mycoplasma sp. P36-A1 TaxID=3252900 RepID=UPI003C2C3030
MRIDKFLQVSRIIKRRAVAKEIVEKKRVKINDKVAKPSTIVEENDNLEIRFGDYKLILKVLKVEEKVKKENAAEMYEIIEKKEIID